MPRIAESPEAKLAKLLGLEFQEVKEEFNIQEEVSREATAVTELLQGVRNFIKRECTYCGIIFVVDQTNVGMCSDKCRKAHLESLGLVWNPEGRTVEQRWNSMGRHVPLIVPQPVLELIMSALETEQQQPALAH